MGRRHQIDDLIRGYDGGRVSRNTPASCFGFVRRATPRDTNSVYATASGTDGLYEHLRETPRCNIFAGASFHPSLQISHGGGAFLHREGACNG
jgi:hypothetical protein